MSAKEDIGDIIDRQWEDRANSLEQVRRKLRSGWRNDNAVLNQYFQSCVANWKIYKGPRTPKQVVKVQAIYKQAIYGDNLEPPPPGSLESNAGLKWQAWYQLKGTSQEIAKRRFITFLAEIDPLLIDVMPDEKPPLGFPLDRKGQPICAKCNTIVGCARPLLDQNKMNLKQQLFENEDFHEPEKFRAWVKNALANQRCVWGVHQAIANADKKPFMEWFNRDENRGFFAYDSSPLMFIIRELVTYHHEIAYDMMQHKEDVDAAVYNAQSVKATKLAEVYEQLAGEEYLYELVCTRDVEACNTRRLADGGKNHKHAVKIDPPTYSDVSTMEEAIELRMQCQKLGINPSTGVVKDIVQRCDIYRKRIADHFEALKKAALAKERNEKRALTHKDEKSKVHNLSRDMFERQCWDACHMNLVSHILTLVRRGCSPNEESPKGMTPLLTLVINDAAVEQIEELIKLKANVNHVNKYGLTPLMMAVRLGDVKMVHILMRNNAVASQKGGVDGRCVLHWCVVHGCEDLVRTIVEYLRDGVGDALRVTRFLDQQTEDGETALMLAARVRNGSMCHMLCSLGSSPNIRNSKGRNAAYLARSEGWAEIADWLEKKVGAGVAKLETFSDMQFEKQLRYGTIKLKEVIGEFGKTYLTLLQNRISLHPLGSPFVSKSRMAELGDKELFAQRTFVDNHQFFVMKRDANDYDPTSRKLKGEEKPPLDPLDEESLQTLRDRLAEMLALLRQGMTNPCAESAPKPLPWTALMCATVLNDVRTVKLMIREGASPNYPNRAGTTALMLAAQLNNIDVLVELLVMGGDLKAVDNEGYSVLAYAGSLPLPSFMQRDSVGVILDGDTDGPKLLTSTDVIKMALSCGVGNLKQIVQTNANEAQPEQVENHFKFINLLESYGLSGLHSEREVHDQAKTANWRVRETELEIRAQHGDWDDLQSLDSMSTMDSFERAAVRQYHERMAAQKAEEEEKAKKDSALRCPICTLNVPCAHFFKLATLEKYIAKQTAKDAATAAMLEGKRKTTTFHSGKKLKVKNRAIEILEEAHLGDRDTDRSLTLARKYREKEMEVDKITEQRLLNELHEKQLLLDLEQNSRSDNSSTLLLRNGEVDDSGLLGIALLERSDSSTANSAPSSPSSSSKLSKSRQVLSINTVDNDASYGGGDLVKDLTPTSSSSAIVSILKPTASAMSLMTMDDFHPDSGSSGMNSPKKSRRVKFKLPGNDLEDDDSAENTSQVGGYRASTSDSVVSGTHSESAENTDEVLSLQSDGSQISPPAASDGSISSDEFSAMPLLKNVDESSDSSSSSAAATTAKSSINLDFIPADGSFHHSVGENPVGNPKQRKVFMFTKDSMHRGGQTDGLIVPTVAADTKAEKLGHLAMLAKHHQLAEQRPINVQISGWIFVSMTDIHSKSNVMETTTVSLDVWGGVLSHIHEKFTDEWLPTLVLESVIDVKTWKPTAPRCSVCGIGFVRFKDSISRYSANSDEYLHYVNQKRIVNIYDDHTLCMSCVIRKTLFERVSAALPRTLQDNDQSWSWPFAQNSVAQHRPPLLRMPPPHSSHQSSGVSPWDTDAVSVLSMPSHGSEHSFHLDDQKYLLSDTMTDALPPSPIRSSKLMQIDRLENQAIGDVNVYDVIETFMVELVLRSLVVVVVVAVEIAIV